MSIGRESSQLQLDRVSAKSLELRRIGVSNYSGDNTVLYRRIGRILRSEGRKGVIGRAAWGFWAVGFISFC